MYVPGEGLAPGVEPPKEDAIVCFSFLRLLDTLHANPQLSCDFSRAGTPVTAQLNSTEVDRCVRCLWSLVCVVAAGL